MRSQLKKSSASSSRDAELSAQFSKASVSGLPPLRNRAGQSTSPYVRAQASSPVAWQLLDDEAILRARKENKLVFVNIGFKPCHCAFLPHRPGPTPATPRAARPILANIYAFQTVVSRRPSPSRIRRLPGCSTDPLYPSLSTAMNARTLTPST